MRLLILLVTLIHLLSCCNGKAKNSTDKNQLAFADIDSIPKEEKFTLLEFVVDEKPCLAMINSKYKNFEHKKDFPLSIFITVNTVEKNKDGHPTDKEAIEFNRLENDILIKTAGLSNCYIGHTTMNGYRDVIFYIKPTDQQKFNSILKKIKEKSSRVKTYVFENDPKWEAVSEFYDALKQGK